MTYTCYDDFLQDVPCVKKAMNNANSCKLMRCNTNANNKTKIYLDGITFTYTGADQQYTIPVSTNYCLIVCGAGSNQGRGGCSVGCKEFVKGDMISIMVGRNGNRGSNGYGFGGNRGGSWGASGGGLTGFFTGNSAIQPTDAARAIIIGGGAGGQCYQYNAPAGHGGGTSGCAGVYGGGGGTQTAGGGGTNQFCGQNGSGSESSGGGAGWYGGYRGPDDEDYGGGGGSGYIGGVTGGSTYAGCGAGQNACGQAFIKII